MGKRARAIRCEKCLIPRAFCVCNIIKQIDLANRVTVVIHQSDATRTTNTGKLIPVALSNSEVLVRGVKDARLDITRAIQPDYHNLVLFPSEDSELLTPEYLAKIDQPINLIVPDGSWNQAAKMMKREKQLKDIPRIHLDITKPSRYRLRTAAYPHWISTFEAIARTLGVMEGAEVQTQMEYLFEITVERLLFLRGEMKQSDVTGGVTLEMNYQYHKDNNDLDMIASLERKMNALQQPTPSAD